MTAAGPAVARHARFDPWTVAALAFALVAVIAHALMPTKDDISWLITNGKALLDGRELYKDIIETNPPLSILIYLPAVLVERLIGLRAEFVTVVLTAVGGLGVGRLCRSRLEAAGIDGGLFEAAFALVFLILPLGAYAQKDHIAALIAVPFLLELALQAEGRGRTSFLSGLLIGLTVAIKPHFVLAIVLPVLVFAARALRARQDGWLGFVFNSATLTGAETAVAFQGFVYLAFPAFFRDVLPMVVEIYVPLREPLYSLLITEKGFLFAALVVIVLLYGTMSDMVVSLLVAGAGFFGAYLLQAKGWPYHLFPATGLGFMALVPAFPLDAASARPLVRQGRSALMAGAMLLVVLLSHSWWMTVTWLDWSPLTRAIVATGIAHPKVINLSSSHDVGHPSVPDAGGVFVGTMSSRWISLVSLAEVYLNPDDPAILARSGYWEARDRAYLLADIRRASPDLILVEQTKFIDWIEWARQTPELAAALDDYAPVATVPGSAARATVVIWRRKPLS